MLSLTLLLIVGARSLTGVFSPLSAQHEIVQLKRGPQTVFVYPSKQPSVSALVLFASGDGGWNALEDQVAQALQQRGYKVVGIDSEVYASSDYDLHTLQADFATLARLADPRHTHPLIVGGYSMGAAQAIAVAGGPNPPPELAGVLLMDPLSRGRYGLRDADKINVLPTGPGTFAATDFAAAMKNLRVVQWHAENDPYDSTDWLASLDDEHREFNFPGAGHGYENDRAAFLKQFARSADWIWRPTAHATAALGEGK